MKDYVFRYRLEPEEGKGVYTDKLTEMVRRQLANILNIAVLSENGKEVAIDGFKLLNNRAQEHIIHNPGEVNPAEAASRAPEAGKKGASFQELKNAAFYEPRIQFIARQLAGLLPVIELEKDGGIVEIDGFRLKELKDWTVPSTDNPSEVFLHAATRCNCSCVFCYNRGNPPSMALVNTSTTLEDGRHQLETRLKYYNPAAHRNLFPSSGNLCEVLCNPHIFEILARLREKTTLPFRLPTNGANLTGETIERLSGLKPVFLDISLHSADTSRRKALMNDPRPEIAIGSLPLLEKSGIPFSVVIVPWPLHSLKDTLDDLDRTTAYAARHRAYMVQVSLPGYTDHFAPGQNPFEREEVWGQAVKRVKQLRLLYSCPIVVSPGIYEEVIDGKFLNMPEVAGVGQNSPAALSGVQRGDIITAINGIPAASRPQARDLLSLIHQGSLREAELTFTRNGTAGSLRVDLLNYRYPYVHECSTHLGIFFKGTGFRSGYLEQIRAHTRRHNAGHVLLLSSCLVRPLLEKTLNEGAFAGKVNFNIEVPRSLYFGGNIIMGDLLVVHDFIECIKDYVKRNGEPDLVIIPSSPFNLSGWGRDLTGRVYLDIQRAVNVPVELVDCSTIYD